MNASAATSLTVVATPSEMVTAMWSPSKSNGSAATRRAEILGHLQRLVAARLGQRQRELLAAVAGEHFLFAHARAHAPRQLLEHVVAGEVPVLVVDLLEVVDVEHHQRQRPLVARAARDLLLEVLDEVALVERLRQTVDDGHAVDLLVVGGLDVAADEELEDRVADLEEIAVTQGVLRDLRVVDVAAVGRAEVLHRPARAGARDLGVAARHRVAVDLDVAVGAAADGDLLGAGELVALAELGAGRVDEHETRLLRIRSLLFDRPYLRDACLPVFHVRRGGHASRARVASFIFTPGAVPLST